MCVVVGVVDIVVVLVAFRYRVCDVPRCAASCVLEPFSNSPLAKLYNNRSSCLVRCCNYYNLSECC